MAQIRVSDDAHVKIMDRRTHVLINTVQVVDDIMAKVDGVKTVPDVALNEPCSECEHYKEELEKSEISGLKIQTMYNNLVVEYKAVREELAVAKADIEALESVSDVVVLDEDDEILG